MAIQIVTGAAGFIGSHLAETLLQQGEMVIGVDQINDYYDPNLKRKNLAILEKYANFEFIEEDIRFLDWKYLLQKAETIYHQAAQAGVRASWGKNFHYYTERNINATQVLLDAARETKSLKRFVFASSSSIYGNAETMPTLETTCPVPVSPYGITKLAAERLCCLYFENFGVPVTLLRYFTVYGPRQRPDMAFHKFFRSAIVKEPIFIYGDGKQTRDYTYVSDAVAANLAAASVPAAVGEAFNIGGGSRVALKDVLAGMEEVLEKTLEKEYIEAAKGDARHTCADTSKARKILGYHPLVSLEEGLAKEWNWIRPLYS